MYIERRTSSSRYMVTSCVVRHTKTRSLLCIFPRHTGQRMSLASPAHSLHSATCRQGIKSTSKGLSRHTLHVADMSGAPPPAPPPPPPPPPPVSVSPGGAAGAVVGAAAAGAEGFGLDAEERGGE